MARELTDKQKRVLSTLEAYWSMHHVPPSISDLAKQLGINKATAYEHLLALKKKGYLLHQARAGRTWRLAQHSKNSPCAHYQIPLLTRVTPGIPLLSSVNIDDHIVTDHHNGKELFALRVPDNAMIKAHILCDDIVIAQQQTPIKDGDVVVAIIDGTQASIRRCEQRLDMVKLNPENDAMAPIELESHRVTLAGKVIEVRRTLF